MLVKTKPNLTVKEIRRQRSLVMLGCLLTLALIFYGVTIVKIAANKAPETHISDDNTP